MRRLGILVLLVGAWLLATLGPAAAQYGEPPAVDAAVSDSTVPPGGSFTLTISELLPGSDVVVTLEGTVVGSDNAGSNGTAVVSVTIPANTPPGPATLVITGTGANGQPVTDTEVISITQPAGGGQVGGGQATGGGAPQVTPAQGLAATGLDVTYGVALAAAFFALGGTLLVISVRRSAARGGQPL